MIRLAVLNLLRALLCGGCFCLAPLAGPAQAQPDSEPPIGLMWNRTGLPAVFPLLVKTPPGQDYFLRLFKTETDEPALAAYIKGGTFFRVLVPPGTYDLLFARGDVWQGEGPLFGAGAKTEFIELDQPLTFAIRDFSNRGGHLLDITFPDPSHRARIEVTDQFICQGTRLSSFPRLQPSFKDAEPYRYRIYDDDQLRRFPSRYSEERLLDSGEQPTFPTRYAPYFSQPEYESRANLC